MEISITTIYIATTVVSIIIAVILILVARSSNPVKTAPIEFRRKKSDQPAVAQNDQELRQEIFAKLGQKVDARLADDLTQAVGDAVQKRIELKTQELSTHYEKIIEQRAQNEEIAWKKYERVLSQKKDTDAVIRSIAQGLVVVDSKGKVVMMNPAAEKLLGSSRKQKVGQPLSDGLREDQLISMVKSSPDKDEREIELLSTQDETKKILRASSAVIENEHGQAVGMVSVLSDITKQKELDELKASFVAKVSHELRTPLIAIDKSIALILSRSTGALTPEQEQFLNIAERNLKRLSRLINDLLDLSKLEAGKMALKRRDVSLRQLISDTVEGIGNWAQVKDIQIVQEISDDLPTVNVDPDRIIQVITNLIGNAVKFTPEGKKVVVRASKIGDKEVQISIADEGIGIAPEHLPKVFDKFYQVGERASTDIHGTGIGLTISKEIVERHGGRIWVESKQGEGASFIFVLPCAEGVTTV